MEPPNPPTRFARKGKKMENAREEKLGKKQKISKIQNENMSRNPVQTKESV
jgi:hypothetical protein